MASIFIGQETTGLDRVAGFFYNGPYIQYVMVVDKRVVLFNTYGDPIYTEKGVRLPNDFVPKSIQAMRSRQSGNLVVGIGGFTGGGSGQRGIIVATDFKVDP